MGVTQLVRGTTDKLSTDVLGKVSKEGISSILEWLMRVNPALKEVIESIDTIWIIQKKETYYTILNRFWDQNGFGSLIKEELLKIYSFDKPDGYAVRGFALDNKNILINLHQIEQSVAEYIQYFKKDEIDQKRDRRYYERDSHYKNFEDYFKDESTAIHFFFWNTLFEQIRGLQQNSEQVDLFEYEYDEESTAHANDMIGFAKSMYEQMPKQIKAIYV